MLCHVFFTYSLHKEKEMRTIWRNTRFLAFKQVHNLRFYLLLPIRVTSSHCDIAFTPEIKEKRNGEQNFTVSLCYTSVPESLGLKITTFKTNCFAIHSAWFSEYQITVWADVCKNNHFIVKLYQTVENRVWLNLTLKGGPSKTNICRFVTTRM